MPSAAAAGFAWRPGYHVRTSESAAQKGFSGTTLIPVDFARLVWYFLAHGSSVFSEYRGTVYSNATRLEVNASTATAHSHS
jgi:hypothetical protein